MSNKEQSPPNVTATPVYEEVRGQIQHEDTLITQRLNWFLTSQSFLFTAFAIVFNGPPPADGVGIRKFLLTAIPVLAITAGILIFLSIVAGMIVMRGLRRFYANREPSQEARALPSIQGLRCTRIMGAGAPVMLPIVFICVWLALAYRTRYGG
jgi:hypothetical protein